MNTIVFDIETGPLPEPELRAVYHEPTFEEFATECDQRWKEETKRAKWEEAKATGWQRFVDRAALSPLTGRVLAIGYYHPGAMASSEIMDARLNEAASLAAFWIDANAVWYAQPSGRLIGHNIFGFDLPFLMRRSWHHDVRVPDWVLEHKRYWSPVFVDTMQVWACGDRQTYIKLDALGRFLGCGGKSEGGCTGADFARLWLSDNIFAERERARAYLERDLELTAEVAEVMGLL